MTNKYIEIDERFNLKTISRFHDNLPSGCYTVLYDGDKDEVYFESFDPKCDDIIDLPSKEYEFIVNQMRHFLKPETKSKFDEYGFIYKRSALLYGKPGTGKTVIVNRIIQEALHNNAIVLFNPDPRLLYRYYQDVNTTDKDKMCLVVFEEFDALLDKGKAVEESLLSLLDGEIQKENVMYLATTNHVDQIPARLKRPGRFGSLVEIGFPSAEARSVYLKAKHIPESEIHSWVEKTEGFSVDELKETVLSTKCLGYNLDDIIARIKPEKEKADYQEVAKEENGWEDSLDKVHLSIARSMGLLPKKPKRSMFD